MKLHQEVAFETEIVTSLITHGGWSAAPDDYEPALALIPSSVEAFLAATRPKHWQHALDVWGSEARAKAFAALKAAVETRGTLDVLRRGFKLAGREIEQMVAWPPESDVNPGLAAAYGANRFEVARQVRPDPATGETVDVVLFINGLPVVTLELKTPLAGQTWRDAKAQYMKRKPSAPLFRWLRAVVHFAVDTERVEMTTRLAKDDTRFLPFDRGCDGGAGNPVVPGKARTSYLWEEVLTVESVVELVQRFAFVRFDRRRKPEALVFPRYHQRDAVRRLVAAALAEGAGHNWLVQHSAGSGKSNTIGWLAHRLATLHGSDGAPVYDKVVVLSDRTVIDDQLRATVTALQDEPGWVVAAVDHSDELAAGLAGAARIVVSTIHKFAFVQEKVAGMPHRRYAVIVDEAHSSQSGELARDLKAVLGGSVLVELAEREMASRDDVLTAPGQAALVAALARGRLPNLSFFAFTATPKAKTLELFGARGADGKPVAAHLYSMRQAIEEGFILDVLRGYTTYRRYYRLVMEGEGDREVPRDRARVALARFVDLHETNVAQKVEVIVEHFARVVAGRLGGAAKAMVVCDSRLGAVRFCRAIRSYLAARGLSWGCLVAFTGEVVDGSVGEVEGRFTEAGMNGFGEKALPSEFKRSENRLLVVAEKYQTGFDEPLLVAMYVDRRLGGITAVQTLSRLNRCHPGKDETFVLDFKNPVEEIKEAFQPYYEGTTTAEMVELGRVDALQVELDGAGVYSAADVEAFAAVFYGLGAGEDPLRHGALAATLGGARDRFVGLCSGPGDDEGREAQERFRAQLGAFVRLYGFVAQLRGHVDVGQEQRYAFGRLLLRLLREEGERVVLGDEVDVGWLRLQLVGSVDVGLEAGQMGQVRGPVESGAGRGDEVRSRLAAVVELLNERFGPEAGEMVAGVVAEASGSSRLQASVRVNSGEAFAADVGEVVEEALADQYAVASGAQERRGAFIEAFYGDAGVRELVVGVVVESLVAAWGTLGVRAAG